MIKDWHMSNSSLLEEKAWQLLVNDKHKFAYFVHLKTMIASILNGHRRKREMEETKTRHESHISSQNN